MRISDWSSDVCSSDLSAFKNKGVQPLLDAVVDYLPSPLDIPPVQGMTPDGTEETRKADDNEPFSALAFKIMTDPFVGTLTFARIYSGKLESASTVLNSVKDKREKIGRMLLMHARSAERRVGKECVSKCRYRLSASH